MVWAEQSWPGSVWVGEKLAPSRVGFLAAPEGHQGDQRAAYDINCHFALCAMREQVFNVAMADRSEVSRRPRSWLWPRLLFLLIVSPAIATFDCPGFVREEPAKSVWSLSPSQVSLRGFLCHARQASPADLTLGVRQVDVIMALGDSITAAFGANGRRGGLVSSFAGEEGWGGVAGLTYLWPAWIVWLAEGVPRLVVVDGGRRERGDTA